MHPLVWDHAGDPPWDPLPLPDLEPEPDNDPDELEELCLDLRPDPEPLQEEEEELDCERHGEGDLVHVVHLVGECATGETAGDVGGMPSLGHSSASHSVCLGTVEMEADRPMPHWSSRITPCAVEDGLLQHIFGLPADCQVAGCVRDPGCGAPTLAAEHKTWAQTL